MLNVFDSYERVARVYPAILISLPIIFTCYSFSVLVNSPIFIKIASSSLIVLVGLVLMSFIVRFFGKKIEPKLWKKWAGAPSTRFLRLDDRKLAKEIKERFYKKVLADANIDLISNITDGRIEQAFAFVRNVLRVRNKDGLWKKFNEEYGFARNLMGSRWIWSILSFGLSLFCYLSIKYFPKDIIALMIGAILNSCSGLAAIFCGWFVLPGLTKGIAEKYAEEAILSYINLD